MFMKKGPLKHLPLQKKGIILVLVDSINFNH